MTSGRSLHNSDLYAGSLEQAALLRAGRAAEADLEAIAEEIESMGKTEKRELVSRLRPSCCISSNGAISRPIAARRGGRRSPTLATRSSTISRTIPVSRPYSIVRWSRLTDRRV
jgi:Domain of unknown function DUF29